MTRKSSDNADIDIIRDSVVSNIILLRANTDNAKQVLSSIDNGHWLGNCLGLDIREFEPLVECLEEQGLTLKY